MDLKLRGELGRYHDHVKARPADAIYRDASADCTGPGRLERLTRNLLRALQDEMILLVLDLGQKGRMGRMPRYFGGLGASVGLPALLR